MEQSSCWECSSCSANQSIMFIKQNRMIHKKWPWPLSLAYSKPHLYTHFNICQICALFAFVWGLMTKVLCIYIFSLLTCYMLHLSYPSWCDHSNNIWWRLQIMKLSIMSFSPLFIYFISDCVFCHVPSNIVMLCFVFIWKKW